MDSYSPTFCKHLPVAAGSAPRRPILPRELPTLQSDSSASLLTCLPSVTLGSAGKALPARPVSNLRDYMPPSASRSSWSGMPFAQFERRLLHADQPGSQPDVPELQAFLVSRIEEMNRRRAMLSLPAWKVPMNDLSLMRHVCKVWWGEDFNIPEVKKTGVGREVKYEIDYESIATAREIEEILLEKPLIEISTKQEQEEARKAEEERRENSAAVIKFYMKRYANHGVAIEKPARSKRRETNKPSVFVEIWGNVGHILRISSGVSPRDSDYTSDSKRTRLGARVFRRRRQYPVY